MRRGQTARPRQTRDQSNCARGRVGLAAAAAAESLERRILFIAGDLDPTFSGDGMATAEFFKDSFTTLRDSRQGVAIQSGGKILTVGSSDSPITSRLSPDVALLRHNADGTPDLTFGSAGQVIIDFPGLNASNDDGFAVALQSDGKILIAGRTNFGSDFNTGNDFALVRLTSEGVVDTSFGSGGYVRTALGNGGADDQAFDLAVQPDGKVVLVGQSGSDTAIARYTPSGQLDTTFDGDGKLVVDLGGTDRAQAVAIDGSGRIVIAGSSDTDVLVARFTLAGAPDSTFDGDGKVVVNYGGADVAYDVAVAGNSILVGGAGGGGADATDLLLARFTATGAPDATFNGTGSVLTNLNGVGESVRALQLTATGIVVTGTSKSDLLLGRYTNAGVPDAAYGGGDGFSTIDTGGSDLGADVAIDPGGRAVVAGSNNGGLDSVIARFDTAGTPDPTFSGDGVATFDVRGGLDTPFFGSTVLPDGKSVLVGSTDGTSGQTYADFAIAKFNADGSPDTAFGGTGVVTSQFGGADRALAVAGQTDGKIVVAGRQGFPQVSEPFRALIARYNANGSLDTTFGQSNGGVRVLDGIAQINSLAILPDGKILGTGSGPNAVIRFTAGGALDTTYGSAGTGLVEITDFTASKVLPLPGGRTLLVGTVAPPKAQFGTAGLAMLEADGSPVAGFGTNGVKLYSFVPNMTGTFGDVVLDGLTAYLLGRATRSGAPTTNFVTKVDLSTGLADPTFGPGGSGFVTFQETGDELVTGLARQSDGDLLLTGAMQDDGFVARLLPTGARDERFGINGVRRFNFGGEDVRFTGGATIVGDKVYWTGGMSSRVGGEDFAVARLDLNTAYPPQGGLRFATYKSIFNEGTSLTITVSREGGSTGTVTVDYATSDGTAKAGVDYVAASGTLTFGPGETSKTFTITALTDAIEEGSETINVTLSNPTGGAILDNPNLKLAIVGGELTDAGLLDKTFANQGQYISPAETRATFYTDVSADVAIQPDGKIVTASMSRGLNYQIQRLLADGTPDATFGLNGVVETDFALQEDQALWVHVLPDGNILAVGRVRASTGLVTVGLARYLPNGKVDTTFGSFGRSFPVVPSEVSPVGSAVLPDGKILVAIGNRATNAAVPGGHFVMGLLRFNADGSFDQTFNPAGTSPVERAIRLADFNQNEQEFPRAMALQPDGKVVVVGLRSPTNGTLGDEAFGAVRFNADGTVDAAFGDGGRKVVELSTDTDEAYAVAVAPNGRIVMAGIAGPGDDLGVVALTPAGQLDTTFGDGSDGSTIFSVGATDKPTDVAIEKSGKVIVSGITGGAFGGQMFLARLNPDGSPNTSFGIQGVARHQVAFDSLEFSGRIALQDDAKVVQVGVTTRDSFDGNLVVIRYDNDPRRGELSFDEATTVADENQGTVTIGVRRVGGAEGPVTVNYTTNPGTAKAGQDYATTSGTLTFADGETTASIVVPILDDAVIDDNEAFTVTLSAPGGGATLGTQTTHTVTIREGPGSFQFLQQTFYTGENYPTTSITVFRAGGSDGAATVAYGVTGGTAIPGQDYTGGAGVLNFADGERFKTFDLHFIDDTEPEGLETINLALSNPTGGPTLGNPSTALLKLYDFEPGQDPNPGAVDKDFGTKYLNVQHDGDFQNSTDDAVDMTLDPQGRFLIAGTSTPSGGNPDFGLGRMRSDGMPDPLFGGGDGGVVFDLGGTEVVTRMVLQGDGKILVAGTSLLNGKSRLAVARFNADGTVDTTFGDGGKRLLQFNGQDTRGGGALAVGPNGVIYVGGSTGNAFTRDMAVARLTASGNLDTTFDGDGWQTVDFANYNDDVREILVAADGKPLLVGETGVIENFSNQDFILGDVALVRLNTSGALDPTFGTGGKRQINIDQDNDDQVHRAIFDPSGKILVTGTSTERANTFDLNMMVLRLNSDGALDDTFGNGGTVLLGFTQGQFSGSSDEASDVTVTPQGRIVVAGVSSGSTALARLEPDGQLDVGFGSGGLVTQSLGNAVAVRVTGGKAYTLTTGFNSATFSQDFAVTRYLDLGANPVNGTFTFGALSFSATEGTGNRTIEVKVNRSRDAAFGTVSVDYFTAGGTATPGSDYLATSGTITFFEGETSKSFFIPVLNDALPEDNESFQVVLANATGGALVGSGRVAQATIVDDDGKDAGFLAIPSSLAVNENQGTISVNVSRTHPLALPLVGRVTVDYVVTPGTATPGEDFTPVTGTLTFNSGETNKSFQIPILDDNAFEDDETVNIQIFNPTGGARLGSITKATLRIVDFETDLTNNAAALDDTFDGNPGAPNPGNGLVRTDFGPKEESVAAFAVLPGGKYLLAGSSGKATGNYELARYNPDGTLDTTFGAAGTGKVTTDFSPGGSEALISMTVLPDGRFVVSGSSYDGVHPSLILARYNADGTLDATFGTAGKTALALPSFGTNVSTLTVQPDGKLLLSGGADNGADNDLALVRFTANGQLDTAFGTQGQVTYDLGFSESGASVFVQQDGKILVHRGGATYMRFNADGSLDATWGVGGTRTIPGLTGTYPQIQLLPGGKMLLSGTKFNSSFVSTFAIARLNADYTVDKTFGTNGETAAPFKISATPRGPVAIQADGRLVQGGFSSGDFAAARYYADGVPDIGFGTDGAAQYNFGGNDSAVGAAVLSDGKILLAGTAGNQGTDQDFALARVIGGLAFGVVRLNSDKFSVDETAGKLVVTVRRLRGADNAVTVNYSTSDGTGANGAKAGVDYTATSGTLTFGDRETIKTFEIPILDDAIFQGNLTFNIALSNPTGGLALASVASTAVVTIQDDERPGKLQFQSPSFDVNENAGTATVTVTRTDGSGGPVTVHYATDLTGVTASADDFTATSGTLTFADKQTTATFTVPINDDALVENDETIRVTLTAPTGGAALGIPSTAVINIKDNDTPPAGTFRFSSPTYSVVEGAHNALITIERVGGSFGRITGALVATGVDAALNDDFLGGFTSFSFNDGETTKQLSIAILDDKVNEDSETVALSLTGTAAGTPKDATLTIVDDDPLAPGENAPPRNRLPAAQAVDEDTPLVLSSTKGNAITVTDPDAGTSAVRVTLTGGDGTLTLGSVAGLAFSAGDGTGDSAMTFTGTLAAINAALDGTTFTPNPDFNGAAPVTITTNDQGNTGSGGAKSDTDTLTINVNPINDGPVNTVPGPQTVAKNTALTFSAATNNAIFANDVDLGLFIPLQVTLTATNGVLTLPVPDGVTFAEGDGTDDTTMTFLGSPDAINAAMDGLQFTPTANFTGAASLTILSDDLGFSGDGGEKTDSDTVAITVTDRASAVLQFSQPTYTVGEAGPSATITVTRTGVSEGNVSVGYAAAAGNATAGADFTAVSGTLTFANGVVSQTFTVPINNDALDEPDETVLLSLSNATGGATIGGQGAATLTITDDDPAPTVSISNRSVVEGDAGTTGMVFTVQLSAASGRDVSVDFATAPGSASANVDFTPTSGTLTIPAGQTSGTVTVPVLGDNIHEPDETFTVGLANAVNATLPTNPSATGTIQDDDSAGTLRFSSGAYSVAEGAGTVTITVTRTGGSDGPVSVSYATVNGTAGASDYTSASGTLLFADGETSKTFAVTITDDSLTEPAETVQLSLSNATGGATLGSPSTATLTISDNDSVPTLSVANTYSYVERDGGQTVAIQVPVTLSAPSNRDVTFDFATAAGTATAGADFTAASGTLTIPAGQTQAVISITGLGDDLDEADETFTVNLSNAVNAALPANPVVTVTVQDDDSAGVFKFSSATYNVVENAGTATVTVTRTGGSDGAVSVAYATAGGTAGAADYTAAAGTLQFADGETSKTFAVTITDDAVSESSENVLLSLSAPTGGAALGSPASATLTITDDDAPAGPAVSNFALFDAKADRPVPGFDPLLDGSVLDLTNLPAQLTIEARTTPQAVGSVVFVLDGKRVNVEDTFHYTLAGNKGGDYRPFKTFTLGHHVLTATPYSKEDGKGAAGAPMSVSFDGIRSAPLPTVSVKASDASATERGRRTGTFTISRTGSTSASLVVNYEVAGTATAGADYDALGGTVTIPKGKKSVTLAVRPVDDRLSEPTETVLVTLSPSPAAYKLGPASSISASVRITDNDRAPKLMALPLADAPTAPTRQPVSGAVRRSPFATAPTLFTDADDLVTKLDHRTPADQVDADVFA